MQWRTGHGCRDCAWSLPIGAEDMACFHKKVRITDHNNNMTCHHFIQFENTAASNKLVKQWHLQNGVKGMTVEKTRQQLKKESKDAVVYN